MELKWLGVWEVEELEMLVIRLGVTSMCLGSGMGAASVIELE